MGIVYKIQITRAGHVKIKFFRGVNLFFLLIETKEIVCQNTKTVF